jgi:hypothetical protein
MHLRDLPLHDLHLAPEREQLSLQLAVIASGQEANQRGAKETSTQAGNPSGPSLSLGRVPINGRNPYSRQQLKPGPTRTSRAVAPSLPRSSGLWRAGHPAGAFSK